MMPLLTSPGFYRRGRNTTSPWKGYSIAFEGIRDGMVL